MNETEMRQFAQCHIDDMGREFTWDAICDFVEGTDEENEATYRRVKELVQTAIITVTWPEEETANV